MIRLGINTMVWSGACGGDELSLLERIRGYGYTAVELPVFDFAAVDRAAVRDAVHAAGLSLTVSSALPDGLSLVSDDSSVRRQTRRWLDQAVHAVASMGGTMLAGPMYAPVGCLPGRRRTPLEWQWAVEEYTELARSIAASGVRIAIEPLNRFETYFLNTAADARRLCEDIGDPAFGVLFDTFHANIEETDSPAAIRSLGHWLIHIHLSENDRGVPGTGHVPFGEVARTLLRCGYSGHVVVESFASSIPEIARATAMWRDYAASPDEFARHAADNMKQVFTGSENTRPE